MIGFDYSDESSAIWPGLFDEHKIAAGSSFIARVGWGAHESLRGVRDFTKSSRLRLEKLLALAEDRQVPIELHIRPFSGAKDFPQWAIEKDSRLVVPYALVDESYSGYAQFQVPSLIDRDVRSGFLDFLKDVFLIAALYRAPDGPLKSIHIDLSSVRSAQNLWDYPDFAESLQSRYGNISEFNALYQLTLTSLASVPGGASEKVLRLCSEKRPWLFAYDYKFALGRLLLQMQKEICALEAARPLQKFVCFAPSLKNETELRRGHTVVLESTLFGSVAGREFPLCPGGKSFPAGAAAYRFSGYLRARCNENAIAYRTVDDLSLSEFHTDTRTIAVITGKQISTPCFAKFLAMAEQGHIVLFPAGFPQFNENMTALSWPQSKRFLQGTAGARPIAHSYPLGAGQLMAPTKTLVQDETFWKEMQNWLGEVGPELGEAQ